MSDVVPPRRRVGRSHTRPSTPAARVPPRTSATRVQPRAQPRAQLVSSRAEPGRRVARAPSRARRLHNLTLDTLRVALATSLASDDPLEFCYSTLGYYTRRAAVPPGDIFILDLSAGHRKFSQCYAALGIERVFQQDYPAGQSDYASRMPTSDAIKRRWYSKMQGHMLRDMGYHFTIFVDVRLLAPSTHTCRLLEKATFCTPPTRLIVLALLLAGQIDEWLVPAPPFSNLSQYLLNMSRAPLRHAVTAPHGYELQQVASLGESALSWVSSTPLAQRHLWFRLCRLSKPIVSSVALHFGEKVRETDDQPNEPRHGRRDGRRVDEMLRVADVALLRHNGMHVRLLGTNAVDLQLEEHSFCGEEGTLWDAPPLVAYGSRLHTTACTP